MTVRFSPEKDYFLSVLTSLLSRTSVSVPPSMDESIFFNLCQAHHLAGMTSAGIGKYASQFSEKTIKLFYQENRTDICQELIQTRESMILFREFEKNEIPFLPLKGSILRKYYPSPDMRTMKDIDILIPENCFIKAKAIFKKQEYSWVDGGDHHDCYVKPPTTCFEVHRRLFGSHHLHWLRFERDPLADSDLWPRFQLKKGWKYYYEMTPEDFYLCSLIHMASHFIVGGIGVRFVMDHYLLSQVLELSPEKEPVSSRLKRMELDSFAMQIDKISKIWFGGAQSEPSLEELENYILDSGVKGTLQNHFAYDNMFYSLKAGDNQSVKRGNFFQKISRFRYVIAPSWEQMISIYSSLKKYPFLYPYYCLLLNGRRLLQFSHYWKKAGKILRYSEDSIEKQKKFYAQCGLVYHSISEEEEK